MLSKLTNDDLQRLFLWFYEDIEDDPEPEIVELFSKISVEDSTSITSEVLFETLLVELDEKRKLNVADLLAYMKK
jgi:hypothetical protein